MPGVTQSVIQKIGLHLRWRQRHDPRTCLKALPLLIELELFLKVGFKASVLIKDGVTLLMYLLGAVLVSGFITGCLPLVTLLFHRKLLLAHTPVQS